MSLLNAGHGVSIAAHDGRLWTEADSHPDSLGEGYGSRLATFRFAKNGNVNLSPGAQGPGINRPDAFHRPHQGTDYDQYTCAIDPTPGHERLIIRYRRGKAKWFEVFKLGDALAGHWGDPVIGKFTQPEVSGDFQGYTAMGNYLYLFSGKAKDNGGSQYPPTLYGHNMITGGQQIFKTTAGHKLDHWEPEGLAIYRPANGHPRLFFGFATGRPGHYNATLFYKQRQF